MIVGLNHFTTELVRGLQPTPEHFQRLFSVINHYKVSNVVHVLPLTIRQRLCTYINGAEPDTQYARTHAREARKLQYLYGTCLATYEPADSSTYKLVDADAFTIQYLDTSGAEGDYIKDTFHIAGTSIEALQVGLAENSSINSGLLGIGFNTNVAAAKPYPNIIDLLVNQDLIASKAYSLYLDDLYAETGTVLFGGIDTRKFIGRLREVDILPDARSNDYTSFTVALGSLKVNSSSSSNGSELLDEEIPVILDSGTTLTYLPPRVARRIFETFNAVDDTTGTGLVYASCDLLSSEKDTTVEFRFGGSNGPLIRIPIDEIVLDNVKGYISIGLDVPTLPFDDVCSFGIQPLSNIYLLGDTFLRSAYVVYDLSNNKIALAQANLNGTESNVIEIPASGIPLVSGVAAQQTPSASSHSDSTGDSGSESSPDNAAARGTPALNWEVTSVTFAAIIFSLVGAGLFAF
ncbi:hypothetical protein O1611_g4504 [Lasiodiplodia mahajangana]|uniref:Uncharacterized protein n=1 Tax=Lasiodiplodia mahajangana TaxID=1108764 RepID=A0ACC2JP44_9PEZI|nr:hypothetical protein O1611_g4504 [Lasiodiplodia mahajangana]